MISMRVREKRTGRWRAALIILLALTSVGLLLWPALRPLTGAAPAARPVASARRGGNRARHRIEKPRHRPAPAVPGAQGRPPARAEAAGAGMSADDACDRLAPEAAYWLVTLPKDARDAELSARFTPAVRRTILPASRYAFDNPPYTAEKTGGDDRTASCLVHVTKDEGITIGFTRRGEGWTAVSLTVPAGLLRPATPAGT